MQLSKFSPIEITGRAILAEVVAFLHGVAGPSSTASLSETPLYLRLYSLFRNPYLLQHGTKPHIIQPLLNRLNVHNTPAMNYNNCTVLHQQHNTFPKTIWRGRQNNSRMVCLVVFIYIFWSRMCLRRVTKNELYFSLE